jgi:hypothetical protein
LAKKSIPKESNTEQVKGIIDIIHSDVVGRITPMSEGGSQYAVTFIDECTNYVFVRMLKRKCDVFHEFVKFQNLVEKQTGRQIKCIQSDNGDEYISLQFQNHLDSCGIARRLTVPGMPEQNGKAERMNLTLFNMVRCMLIESKVPHRFWAEALNTAVYIRNRCPSKAVNFQIPFELWEERDLTLGDLDNLKVFGCQAWVIIKGGKLDPRGEECVFMGYPEGTKGYCLWSLSRGKIILSRDVTFVENVFPFQEINQIKIGLDERDNCTLRFIDEVLGGRNNVEEVDDLVDAGNEEREIVIGNTEGENLIEPRRSARVRRHKLCSQCDECCLAASSNVDFELPKNVREALTGKFSKYWRAAMNEEMKHLTNMVGPSIDL